MQKFTRFGFATAVLTAIAVSAISAPVATADVTRVAAEGSSYESGPPCYEVGCTITMNALVEGANVLDPVTLYIDGTPIASGTPGPVYQNRGAFTAHWVPTHTGTYTLSATQGQTTKSTTFQVIDGDGVPDHIKPSTGSF